MKSIKNKMLVLVLILVTIPFIISNLINYYYVSTTLKSTTISNNIQLSQIISGYVSAYMDKAYSLSESLSTNSAVMKFDQSVQKDILLKTSEANPYFDLLYVEKSNGAQTARSNGYLENWSSKWWFSQITTTKKPFVTKSYFESGSNKAIVSIIFPLLDSNYNLLGVLGSDIKLSSLEQLITEKCPAKKGSFVYILDSDGVVIAHPDKIQVDQMYNYITAKKTIIQKDKDGLAISDGNGNIKTISKEITVPDKLKEITKKALNGDSGYTEYKDVNGDNVISSYSTIKIPGYSKNWAVITVEKKSSALSIVNDLRYKNALIGLIILAAVFIIVTIFSNKFTAPIINIASLLKNASNGNLNVKSDFHSKDEIGILSDSFNTMIDNFKGLLHKINTTSLLVESSSKTLASNTEETEKSLISVAKTISQVAIDAGKQAESSENGYEAISKLIDNLEKMINLTSSSPSTNVKNILSPEDLQNIKNLKSKMLGIVFEICSSSSDIAAASEEVSAAVEEQTASSEQINELAHELNALAKELDSIIKNFSLD